MEKQDFNNNLPAPQANYTTEQDVRNLITSALANYTGIVKFTNLQTVIVTITDFTTAQHTHANAAGGGQLNLNNVSTTPLTVSNGGSGTNSLTGVLIGNGAGAFTATVPLAGTKTYWVSDTNGGATSRKLTFVGGILTAET